MIKKSYWFHLPPQTPQSGSCQRHIPGTPATCEQQLKRIACCITPPSMQRPTLPAEADYQEPQSDDESENGDVPDLKGEIRGWTVNFGLSIPVKEGKEFVQLPTSHLQCHQTQWRHVKLLILDKKSMVGRAQMGHCDRHLRQAFPESAGDSLGGVPAIFFGDFAQLPPIGDTPLYTTTSSARKHALIMEGRHVFEGLKK